MNNIVFKCVRGSVMVSVWITVRDSVKTPIGYSVWDSVEDSVRDYFKQND